MKKNVIVLIAVFCALIAIPAQAQILQFGVKGGANVSKISNGFDRDNMGGFFIGPMAEVTIPIIGLGVDAALLYMQKGVKSEENNFKQSGLDIPVNLKYTIGLGSMFGIYGTIGPDFFFNFKDDSGFIKKRNAIIGMNFGAGIKLLRHLQIGFNYNIPLGKSGELTCCDGLKNFDTDYKIKTWQISAAYMF